MSNSDEKGRPGRQFHRREKLLTAGQLPECEWGITYTNKKIASEMPVPHSLGKLFSTPWDKEVVKQYKDQDTFRAVSVI